MNLSCINRSFAARAAVLVLGAALLMNLSSYGFATGTAAPGRALSDAEMAGLVGGLNWGACGILVGIGVGVVALGSSTVTVGIGAAVAISVGAHVAAAICVS